MNMEERVSVLEGRYAILDERTSTIKEMFAEIKRDVRDLPDTLGPVIENKMRDAVDRHSYNCKKSNSNPPGGTKKTEISIPINWKVIWPLLTLLLGGAATGIGISSASDSPQQAAVQQNDKP